MAKKNIFTKTGLISPVRPGYSDQEYFNRDVSGGEIFAKENERRFSRGFAIAIIFVLVLAVQLFFLQIKGGLYNLKLAEGNRVRSIPVAAPRGAIVDDTGKPLVKNEAGYQLVTQIAKTKDLKKVDENLFLIIGMSRDEVAQKISQNNLAGNIVLKEKIPREEALVLKAKLASYGGFEIDPTYLRKYSDINLCHVLGYIGKVSQEEAQDRPALLINQTTGKSGLEKVYDEYLQGLSGERKTEVDAGGRLVRYLSTVEPLPGATIQTSIDEDLQNYAAGALEAKLNELGTKGSLIAQDPRDGSIKALVSYPYFDNTKLSAGLTQDEYKALAADPAKPLLNRAVSGEYPPGSSIKPFLASAALQDGVINEDLAFDTPPAIEIGQWRFPDWKDHGLTDVKRAIAESNNIFFFAVGGGYGPIKNGLGPDRIKNGLEKFSFGLKTGVDLGSEADGFIPTPEWKKKATGETWFIGNTYNMSIGQGDLLVTPLQLANATSAIANGGTLYEPHFVQKIVGSNGVAIKEYKNDDNVSKKDIYSGDNLRIVREGMRQTVTTGSARSVFGNNFPLAVAGKTGTAQFGTEGKTHAWFTSFAPYDNPELVLTVLVEGGGEGFDVAAPIAKDVYQWWAQNK